MDGEAPLLGSLEPSDSEHEQNLAQFQIGVVILVARSNRMVDYEPLTASLRITVDETQQGEARIVAAEPSEFL